MNNHKLILDTCAFCNLVNSTYTNYKGDTPSDNVKVQMHLSIAHKLNILNNVIEQ